jgi:4-hydroxy-tetrahydrodipicolinate reductase
MIMPKKRVAIIGCCGKMGQVTSKYLLNHPDYVLAACIDVTRTGQDIGKIIGVGETGIHIEARLQTVINNVDIAIDLTAPDAVVANATICLQNAVPVLIGTTGISEADCQNLDALARKTEVAVMIVPNFAIGAILMMDFAKKAARIMKSAEIIEMHHDQKKDKPSGTALKTRAGMLEAQGITDKAAEQIPIHSVRLPGLVAHQAVIFGDAGQTLTIRHDSINRESFMPGIGLALQQMESFTGLRIGLEI